MSARFFCDRCGRDVTDEDSGAISGVQVADERGDGTVTHTFDHVCHDCYQAWLAFMRAPGHAAAAEQMVGADGQ